MENLSNIKDAIELLKGLNYVGKRVGHKLAEIITGKEQKFPTFGEGLHRNINKRHRKLKLIHNQLRKKLGGSNFSPKDLENMLQRLRDVHYEGKDIYRLLKNYKDKIEKENEIKGGFFPILPALATVGTVIGTIKGIYDVGKTIYDTGKTIYEKVKGSGINKNNLKKIANVIKNINDINNKLSELKGGARESSELSTYFYSDYNAKNHYYNSDTGEEFEDYNKIVHGKNESKEAFNELSDNFNKFKKTDDYVKFLKKHFPNKYEKEQTRLELEQKEIELKELREKKQKEKELLLQKEKEKTEKHAKQIEENKKKKEELQKKEKELREKEELQKKREKELREKEEIEKGEIEKGEIEKKIETEYKEYNKKLDELNKLKELREIYEKTFKRNQPLGKYKPGFIDSMQENEEQIIKLEKEIEEMSKIKEEEIIIQEEIKDLIEVNNDVIDIQNEINKEDEFIKNDNSSKVEFADEEQKEIINIIDNPNTSIEMSEKLVYDYIEKYLKGKEKEKEEIKLQKEIDFLKMRSKLTQIQDNLDQDFDTLIKKFNTLDKKGEITPDLKKFYEDEFNKYLSKRSELEKQSELLKPKKTEKIQQSSYIPSFISPSTTLKQYEDIKEKKLHNIEREVKGFESEDQKKIKELEEQIKKVASMNLPQSSIGKDIKPKSYTKKSKKGPSTVVKIHFGTKYGKPIKNKSIKKKSIKKKPIKKKTIKKKK
jgi:hypothetical protein